MRDISRFFRRQAIAFTLIAIVAGCGRPPDPNDPTEVGLMQPEVLQRNLKWASEFVNERVAMQEIDEKEGQRLLQEYAETLTGKVEISKILDVDAWRYGDVFRTAKRWDLAAKAFEVSTALADKNKNMDRWVNDTLHLAEAKANLGDIDSAIALTRSTFKVEPKDKAPILLATLYEIVPPMIGKGKDVEVADLLMDAIDQHQLVIVNIQTEEGAKFYAAKGHHFGKAWEKVFELLASANKPELLKQAQNRKFRTSSRGA